MGGGLIPGGPKGSPGRPVACVRIVTGSRLHAGFHTLGDPRVAMAGAGFYAARPRHVVRVEEGGGVEARDPGLAGVVREALSRLGLEARVVFEEEIPRHVGLGSTTQAVLAAAVGALILAGRDPRRGRLWAYRLGVHRLGRSRGSTVGSILFETGGFTLDPGVPPVEEPRPLATRVPEEWAYVIVLPRLPRGRGEAEEEEVLRRPPRPGPGGERLMERGLRLLLLGIMRRDHHLASEGLGLIQAGTGEAFSRLQGGVYRGDLQAIVAEAGRDGIHLAQSSWGPALYTITERGWAESDAKTLRLIMGELGLEGEVIVAEPRNEGASVSPCNG